MPDNPISALYPQPPKPQESLANDPLKLLGVMGAINQNTQFQQTQNAKRIYQNALRPDGTIDTNALTQGLRNPNATGGAPEVMGTVLGQQGTQIENTTKQLGLDTTRNQVVIGGLSALADDPHPTMEKVRDFGIRWAKQAGIPAPIINGWMRTVREQSGGTEAGLKSVLGQFRVNALGPAGASGRITGPPDVSGAPTQTSTGAVYSGGPQPSFPTEPPPGVRGAKEKTAAGSAEMLASDRSHGADYQRQVFPLEQAIPALEKLGPQGTGPGTETFNHIKSFLVSAGIPGIDPDKIRSYDEAKKYLTDFVNQTGNSGTNDKLAAAFAGNPSVNISNAAAIDVAKAALALRRFKQAQLSAFERSGEAENDYGKFASKWNVNNDPRAYGFDIMTPKQRKDVLDSLPKNKRELFMMAVQDAAEQGLIRAPGAR